MRLLFLVVSAIISLGLGVFATPTQAASLPLSAVMRVEVHSGDQKVLASGTGLMIDADGRVLINSTVLDKFSKDPGLSLWLCQTKTATDEPLCWLKAAVLRRNVDADLALLQVTSLAVGNGWISPEEHAIRTAFRFVYNTPNLSNLTSEAVTLGDSLSVLRYGTSTNSAIRQQSVQVTGFARRLVNGKTLPSLVRFSPSLTETMGGAFFNASSTFVGLASGKDTFISIPMINRFLTETLGTDYLQRKSKFLLTNELVGTQNGLLTTHVCPEFSSADSGSHLCRCNTGFFAVGYRCLVGNTYCKLLYPGKGQYDAFAKTCICQNADGRQSCPKPAPLNKPAPPPKAAPLIGPPSPPVNPTPFYCPLNAHYDAVSWACVCNVGYAKNAEKTACVLLKAQIEPKK